MLTFYSKSYLKKVFSFRKNLKMRSHSLANIKRTEKIHVFEDRVLVFTQNGKVQEQCEFSKIT